MAAPEITLVDADEALSDALARVDEQVVGVDVERGDGRRYRRPAALVQVGADGRAVLVDPLGLRDLGPLARYLASRTVVLHAAQNDLAPLAEAGAPADRFHDTALAASLLNLPLGLDVLLRDILDVVLDGDKERYQRADWERRPLTQGMLAYAADDVVHLPQLWARLQRRLVEAGRTDWYEQERAHLTAESDGRPRDWRRVRGAGRLDPRLRAVLREVWTTRERLAEALDVAPNRLLREETMLHLVTRGVSSPEELVRRNRRRSSPLAGHAAELLAARDRGMDADPVERERGRPPVDQQILAALRRTRTEVAASVDLDPGVLCPARTLKAAVSQEPTSADDLCDAAGFRPWQRELLAQPLWRAYRKARNGDATAD